MLVNIRNNMSNVIKIGSPGISARPQDSDESNRAFYPMCVMLLVGHLIARYFLFLGTTLNLPPFLAGNLRLVL